MQPEIHANPSKLILALPQPLKTVVGLPRTVSRLAGNRYSLVLGMRSKDPGRELAIGEAMGAAVLGNAGREINERILAIEIFPPKRSNLTAPASG